jgi:serine phosphatase RsbU (regulator of sigma subunit)
VNILFWGIRPTKTLETVLLTTGGFSIKTTSKLPETNRDWIPDLVAFAPKNPLRIEESSRLREKFPKAWLCLVVKREWLKNTEIYHSLLKNSFKDEVWIKEVWEQTFWFSLQSFTRVQGLTNDNRQLKRHGEQLTAHSNSLLAQFEKDVEIASNIQRSLLPKFYPEIPGVTVSVKYIPAAGLGGDYYDIFEFGDKKRFGILIADSKTHGMAASLLSVLVKVRLEEMKDRFPDSKSFVDFLNREIQLVNRDKAPLSLLYGILDRSSLSFQYTSAGNLKPLLWRNSGSAPLAAMSNPPLGDVNHYDFKENSISLRPGDLMIFYTDGLEALVSRDKTKRGAEVRLTEILKSKGPSPDPLEVQNDLMGIVNGLKNKHELPDDLTVIHFSINERTLYLASQSEI